MENEIYDIFRKSFENINLSKEEFINSVNFKNSHLEVETIDEKIVGFALSNNDTISMVCVLPEYRNKGIGSKLLEKSEKVVKEKGYKQINIGDTSKYNNLFIGVPSNTEASSFFSNNGYDDEFFSRDYEIDVEQIKEKCKPNDNITVVNYQDPDFMSLFMQFLSVKDKNSFERYAEDRDIKFLVAKKDTITGVCAYTIDYNDINPGICVFDLISYPSFDVETKKALLLKLADVALENEYSKLTIKNSTNNPLIENYNGKEVKKYWKGSKSIG